MNIKAGGVCIFTGGMTKLASNMFLVGPLVPGKSRVLVDTKHGTAVRAGVRDVIRGDIG
jgi:hypothetical protein